MEGLKEWMDAVHTARVPCAVVSSLDRKTMIEALDHLKLTKYFQVGNGLAVFVSFHGAVRVIIMNLSLNYKIVIFS